MVFRISIDLYFNRELTSEDVFMLIDTVKKAISDEFKEDFDGWGLGVQRNVSSEMLREIREFARKSKEKV